MLLYVMDVSDDIENIKLNFSVPGFIVYPAIVMLLVSFVEITEILSLISISTLFSEICLLKICSFFFKDKEKWITFSE